MYYTFCWTNDLTSIRFTEKINYVNWLYTFDLNDLKSFNIFISDQPTSLNTTVAEYADDKAILFFHDDPHS